MFRMFRFLKFRKSWLNLNIKRNKNFEGILTSSENVSLVTIILFLQSAWNQELFLFPWKPFSPENLFYMWNQCTHIHLKISLDSWYIWAIIKSYIIKMIDYKVSKNLLIWIIDLGIIILSLLCRIWPWEAKDL